MRYVNARYQEYRRDLAYRIYLTDSLQVITKNTAGLSKEGAFLKERYIKLIENDRKPQDTRTAEEIALDVMIRAGLSFKEEVN